VLVFPAHQAVLGAVVLLRSVLVLFAILCPSKGSEGLRLFDIPLIGLVCFDGFGA